MKWGYAWTVRIRTVVNFFLSSDFVTVVFGACYCAVETSRETDLAPCWERSGSWDIRFRTKTHLCGSNPTIS